MGNCFTSEPQECVQCIVKVKVRDQETQTQLRQAIIEREQEERKEEMEVNIMEYLERTCTLYREISV